MDWRFKHLRDNRTHGIVHFPKIGYLLRRSSGKRTSSLFITPFRLITSIDIFACFSFCFSYNEWVAFYPWELHESSIGQVLTDFSDPVLQRRAIDEPHITEVDSGCVGYRLLTFSTRNFHQRLVRTPTRRRPRSFRPKNNNYTSNCSTQSKFWPAIVNVRERKTSKLDISNSHTSISQAFWIYLSDIIH